MRLRMFFNFVLQNMKLDDTIMKVPFKRDSLTNDTCKLVALAH